MNKLLIPCDVGEVSDGYHTFNELYEHRCLLFAAWLKYAPVTKSWRSLKHEDGSSMPGWFIAGMDLPTGTITYHLPLRMWDLMRGVRELEFAPKWDGHTSEDVIQRLTEYLSH